MDKQELNALTDDLIDNVFRNSDMVFDLDNEHTVDYLEVIASLHNMLYKQITGSYYDYMGHHYNKTAGGWLEDGLYKKYEGDNR